MMRVGAALFSGALILVGAALLDGEARLDGAALLDGGAQALTPRPSPARIDVAPGVHLFRTAPYGEVGLDGNSIVIISEEGVLVFDTNGTPSAAEAVLAEIRKLTAQPVRYVVNSHWHWDHWYGTEVYTRAFPGVQVIAHEKTRMMMAGPAIEFNRPGLESQLPSYLKQLEQRIVKAEAATAPPPELARLKQSLADGRFFLEQKNSVRHTLPTLTFTTSMTLHLGDREIQVRHHDRAVTPGDTFLYLPKEKIVIAGDLLVNPISFALSSYPTGWVKTLEYIDSLDAAVIVPGHGEPLRDKQLLHATLGVFRELITRGGAARARGLDPDTARAEIMPQIKDFPFGLLGLPFHADFLASHPWIPFVFAVGWPAALVASSANWWDSRRDAGQLLALSVWILSTVAPVATMLFVADDLEGSRYLYLGSAAWSIMIAVLVRSFRTGARAMVIAPLLMLSLIATHAQQSPWLEAARERERILDAFRRSELACRPTVVRGLPDAIRGAYVFRNGFAEATVGAAHSSATERGCVLVWDGKQFSLGEP